MLHNNELPFKNFFKYCDQSGSDYWKDTKCPAYSGHIGKNFKPKLRILPVLPFTAIRGKVKVYSPDFVATFNNDSRYFYQMCHAVQDGVVSPPLASKVISRVDQARLIFSPGISSTLKSFHMSNFVKSHGVVGIEFVCHF